MNALHEVTARQVCCWVAFSALNCSLIKKLQYVASVGSINKQQKFYSLPKRYNKIQHFEQRPFLHELELRKMLLSTLLFFQGRPIILCSKGDEEVKKYAFRHVEVPQTVDCLQGILTVIPLQLLSFHVACLRGYDVSITS
jgi:hypothetical protein